MELLFENTTKYSKKVYDEFLEFHRKKFRVSYILYTALIIAFILFCIILQVGHHNLTLAIVFCIALTCFFLWRLLHPISQVTKEYQSEKIQNEKSYTFKFYKKHFTVQDNKEISEIKYGKLYKIFETKTFFYLYLDRSHAILLNKLNFSTSSNDFSSFIKKKCWWKYSNKSK